MLPFEFNLGLQHNLNCICRHWATLIFMAWIIKVMKKWQVCLQYILCQSTWDPGYLASIAICSMGSPKVFAPVVPKINTSCGVPRYSAVRNSQRLTEIAHRRWAQGKGGNLLAFFQWFFLILSFFFFSVSTCLYHREFNVELPSYQMPKIALKGTKLIIYSPSGSDFESIYLPLVTTELRLQLVPEKRQIHFFENNEGNGHV